MQIKTLLSPATCLGLLLAPLFVASPAHAGDDALVPPVPIHAVPPLRIPAGCDNATVRVSLEIDAQGQPHQIDPLGLLPTEARELFIAAVKRWKFRPATRQGVPVNVRVILPVKLAVGD